MKNLFFRGYFLPFAETQRDIHQRATDELQDAGLDQIHLSFYMTSIYDHSIFEAFSKVVQKLIPQLPMLENLLNILISVCERHTFSDTSKRLVYSSRTGGECPSLLQCT